MLSFYRLAPAGHCLSPLPPCQGYRAGRGGGWSEKESRGESSRLDPLGRQSVEGGGEAADSQEEDSGTSERGEAVAGQAQG